MPRGKPGTGPYAKNKDGKKVTKSTKPAAAKTARKTAAKSPKKKASKK